MQLLGQALSIARYSSTQLSKVEKRSHSIFAIATQYPTPGSQAQSTVDFPIGGHVNVLSDYKETGPENFFLF